MEEGKFNELWRVKWKNIFHFSFQGYLKFTTLWIECVTGTLWTFGIDDIGLDWLLFLYVE